MRATVLKERKVPDGKPCIRKACHAHTKTPCSLCKRIGMKGEAIYYQYGSITWDNF